jgi:actin-like ATPase involved in cell morphogenesis
MKNDVLAALPAITGIASYITGMTYSIELRSGSIIAKVTITIPNSDTSVSRAAVATAAASVVASVTLSPISVIVDGQTVTSTGARLVVATASGAMGLASFSVGGMAVVILANLIRPFVYF